MDELLKIIDKNLCGGKKVLELGCGAGDLIRAFAARHPETDGIAAVDYFNAPQNLPPQVKFIKQDLERLELTGSFDLIIINHVLEHIKDPLGLLGRAKKLLAEHGRILIVVPNRRGFGNEARVYLPEHGKHYFLWDRESLEFSLNRMGFTCRFFNLYAAASHGHFLKYLPMLLRIQNPNLTCIAMPDIAE
jgi:SAM-dependent methyltransferase